MVWSLQGQVVFFAMRINQEKEELLMVKVSEDMHTSRLRAYNKIGELIHPEFVIRPAGTGADIYDAGGCFRGNLFLGWEPHNIVESDDGLFGWKSHKFGEEEYSAADQKKANDNWKVWDVKITGDPDVFMVMAEMLEGSGWFEVGIQDNTRMLQECSNGAFGAHDQYSRSRHCGGSKRFIEQEESYEEIVRRATEGRHSREAKRIPAVCGNNNHTSSHRTPDDYRHASAELSVKNRLKGAIKNVTASQPGKEKRSSFFVEMKIGVIRKIRKAFNLPSLNDEEIISK